MQNSVSAATIVQQQLDAYNAKDLDAWLATYAADAKQYVYPDTLVASGHAEIRARTALRFQEPNLHAKLLHRSVVGNVVSDHEVVTRTFPEGAGHIELLCIYEIAEGKIQRAAFVFGTPVLAQSSS